MADIKVLMVLDGSRLNFGPTQATADTDNFGASQLYKILTGSTTPTIQVDRVHRRGHLFNSADLTNPDVELTHENCSVNLELAGDFVFALPNNAPASTVTADLSQYDVIWMIGDEGNNGKAPGAFTLVNGVKTKVDSPLTDDEKIAIAQFMDGQGGVFAVGDHDAIGFMMSGQLPRVRTMRRWFEFDQVDAGGTAVSVANNQKFLPNYSSFALSGPSTDRNDTLIADAGDGNFYFNGQSDPSPQTLVTATGAALTDAADVHGLLRDANGAIIGKFPDHMHEGIATDFSTVSGTGADFDPNDGAGKPFALSFNGAVHGAQSFTEFPRLGNYQPQPVVIAYTQDSGHATSVPQLPNPPFIYPASIAKNATGAISTYDGRAVGVGRVITGSTFHHYLDKNLLGDPGTQAQPAGATAALGPTGSDTGFRNDNGLLTSIGAYYINAVTWLARPSNNFQFWVLKSTFGVNESLVANNGFPNAFYLVVEGFSPNQIGANPNIKLTGPLDAVGVTFAALPPQPDHPASPDQVQRVLIPYSANALPATAFPAPGTAAKVLALEARATIAGSVFSAEGLFELTASADPFFANVGATNPPNPGYLSQDLRVFELNQGASAIIAFQGSWTGNDFMMNLLSFLNDPANHYTDGSLDPFAQLSLGNDLTEATSVTPTNHGAANFPFALARVRIKNTVATTAQDVRVFFRLFTTSTNDTDFDPIVTYPSNSDAANLPGSPRAGLFGTTFVMTASASVTGDYPGANQQTITVAANQETFAYFGCFLNVYGPSSPIPAGGHHCLVAQIAFDPAPIINSNGLTMSAESTDKLAQRNIVVTKSGNPGGPAAHRIPQTFDTRPSTRRAAAVQSPAGYPDELMIDWNNVPIGSKASLYWPQAPAIDVVRLATLLYPSHDLILADAHTITCTVSSKLTYIPIPFGDGPKLAGLFTIDLPHGVRRGEQFAVIIKRISTRGAPNIHLRGAAARTRGAQAVVPSATRGNIVLPKIPTNNIWRYIVGTFEITIPVDLEEPLLWPEENTLAIFKWRLQQWSPTDRWYPVLQRYVSYLAARVTAFGGTAGSIAASPTGAPTPAHKGESSAHPLTHGEAEFTGKVIDVIFDRFGDYEAFVLQTFSEQRLFNFSEPHIGELVMRALRERLLLSVIATKRHPHLIRQLVVRV